MARAKASREDKREKESNSVNLHPWDTRCGFQAKNSAPKEGGRGWRRWEWDAKSSIKCPGILPHGALF